MNIVLSTSLTLFFASSATFLWQKLSQSLERKFSEKRQCVKLATVKAALSPVIFCIWFIAVIHSVDRIMDGYITEKLNATLQLGFRISAVLFFGWFLLRVKQNITDVLLEKSYHKEISLDPTTVYGIAKLAVIAIFAIITLLLMDVTGVNISTLIAFGGISGLAVAIASQDIIANFFGGIIILVNHPFAIGDLIILPVTSVEGYVEEIGWYETRLRTKDKRPIYIPNSLFSKAYVINNTRRTHSRITEKISVRFADLSQAQAIMRAMKNYLKASPAIDSSQKMLVNIIEVSSTGADIGISCFTNQTDENGYLQFRESLLVYAAKVAHEQGAELVATAGTALPGV